MKNIRKLNSMLFDAAPPLSFIILVSAIIVIPVIMALVGLSMWLIRKAKSRNKKNAYSGGTGAGGGGSNAHDEGTQQK